MKNIEFPAEEITYEIHRTRDGKYAGATAFVTGSKERAYERATELSVEAAENYRMESRGPVKPVKTKYIVIQATTTRVAV